MSKFVKGNKKPDKAYSFPKGYTPWNKGKKCSVFAGDNNPAKRPEVREKIRLAHLGKKRSAEHIENIRKSSWMNNQHGELNHSWKGGISNNPYPIEWGDYLRKSIRERDGYICQECGIHQDELNGFSIKLDVHHIDYNKDNCNPNNLISLCRSCHAKTNFNRDYWYKYFMNDEKKQACSIDPTIDPNDENICESCE